MTTTPRLFGPTSDRPRAVLDAVESPIDEPVADRTPQSDRREGPWIASDVTFAAIVTVTILAIVLGLAWMVSATSLSRAVAGPDIAVADVVSEPPSVPAPEPERTPDDESLSGPTVLPAPLAVRIDTLGIEAPVVSVGLVGRVMEIPDDVREVGWYDPTGVGVRPGATGTAVFASHVDSRTQGRGVLFELRRMRAGDTIHIDLEDGTTQVWVVTDVEQIPKVSMPMGDIFRWHGDPRIALITCGGEFDRSTRSYVDNVVVYAEPVDTASDAPSA